MAGQQDTEHALREGLEKARADMKKDVPADKAEGGTANAQPGVDDTASKSGDPAVPDRTQG